MTLSSPLKPVHELDHDSLEALAAHDVPVAHLAQLWNPYACWIEQATPIRPDEVQACLEAGEEALVETPLWSQLLYGKRSQRIGAAENRQRHIRKIAYFVRHVATDPIELDVGVPALGCHCDELVVDGNHRLAAAMFKGERTIPAHVSGSVRTAQEMGLWHPNAAAQELERRDALALPSPDAPAPARRRRTPVGG